MKQMKAVTLLIILLATNYASALVRISPIRGETDFVYIKVASEDSPELAVQVLKCPTLKECGESDYQCLSDERFWQCEMIYHSNEADACSQFKRGKKAQSILSYAAWGIASTFFPPIHFLSTGLGGILAKGATVANTAQKVMDFNNISCGSLNTHPQELSLDSNTFIHEKETDDLKVVDLISYFTPKKQNEIMEDLDIKPSPNFVSVPVLLAVPSELLESVNKSGN